MSRYSLFSRIIPALWMVAPLPALASHETRSGRLGVLCVDQFSDGRAEPLYQFLLIEEPGRIIRLDLDLKLLKPAGSIHALSGRQVTVTGELSDESGKSMAVQAIELGEPAPAPQAFDQTFGPKPWVTVLCRYSDISATPDPVSYFEGLMVDAAFPSMDHYLREVSYGKANTVGSAVVGWYNLPQPWSYYNWDIDSNGQPEFDTARAIPDCLAVADAAVYYPTFMGIHFAFNAEGGCNAPNILCAGALQNVELTLDSVTKKYGLTFLGPWGYHQQTVPAHEMYHAFGVPHSSGPYTETYDSQWDIMSESGTCDSPHSTYGCLGIHTIAWHKRELGWIDSSRQYAAGTSSARIITLERLESPPLAPGTYLLAKILIGGSSTDFYTIETRRFVGYDALGAIPEETVIIHKVDLTRLDRLAQVVDADGDGDPDDEGAMWEPGEAFMDTPNRILVYVETEEPTRSVISVTNQARDPDYVVSSYVGFEDGSSASPWNTVTEGYAGVSPNGTVYVAPANYNETLTMRKPCTIRRIGSSGIVRIGP